MNSRVSEVLKEILEGIKTALLLRKELWTLKATEKGIPLLAKGIYGTILGVILGAAIFFLLLTLGFALSLMLAEVEAIYILKPLTSGFLTLTLGLFIVFIIGLFLRKKIEEKMSNHLMGAALDKIEEVVISPSTEEQEAL